MILIVDDKPENIFSLKRVLEINGFEVDSAASGEEALKKILKQSYSLIILDVQMPVMDGFEVAEAISGYSRADDIPIIFLSAVNTDKKFIAKGYRSGGVDYVTKPVDPDIFMLKVKTLHRLYEQTRELKSIRISLLAEVETRKQAEGELNKLVKELQSILESLPQVSFTLGPDGDIEFVNQQWYLFSNDGHKFPQHHPEERATWKSMEGAITNKTPFSADLRLKNIITGLYRYHVLKLIPVKENGAVLKWVGTFTDIHEQKQANEELEAKVVQRTIELLNNNKQLENSNHELQQFTSVASHDLKEPLRKVQIFSSIIKERNLNDSPDSLTNINKVIDASARMTGLINDLLNYSRLSVDSLFEPVDLNALTADILADMEFALTEKRTVVNVGPLPIIDAIPGQMRQVFQNLISNSLKFSKKDVPVVIDIRAEIEMKDGAGDNHPADNYCRILISDNGIGFDQKYVEKIFTIFQRLHSTQAYEGTGIGLAIVKKIIEKHNGKISAHGNEGVGATFIISLPLHHTSSATTGFLHNTEEIS